MNLIEQLQAAATEPGSDVTNLLQKALVVAGKLKLTKLKTWVELELNGYAGSRRRIPRYRTVSGSPCFDGPYSNQTKLVFGDPELDGMISTVPIPHALPEIQRLASSAKGDFVQHCYPRYVRDKIMELFKLSNGEPYLNVTYYQFHKLVERIRTEFLSRTVSLVSESLQGSGASIPPEVQETSKPKADIVTPIINLQVAGDISNSLFQIASPQANQNNKKKS